MKKLVKSQTTCGKEYFSVLSDANVSSLLLSLHFFFFFIAFVFHPFSDLPESPVKTNFFMEESYFCIRVLAAQNSDTSILLPGSSFPSSISEISVTGIYVTMSLCCVDKISVN